MLRLHDKKLCNTYTHTPPLQLLVVKDYEVENMYSACTDEVQRN